MSATKYSYNSIAEAYNYILYEGADSDTRSWFMVQSPLPLAGIIILYLLFVIRIGPNFMAKRPPYSLSGAIMAINIFQIIANTWLSMQGASAIWYYYMLKITDLLDTVIYVLRKKHAQLSFLHIYHHFGTLIVAWFAVKYYPGGGTIPIQLFNCLIHIPMFLYYTLAALGPSMTPYLWWKKYLTQIQIVQFFLMLGVNSYIVFSDCSFSKVMLYVHTPYTISILILFLMFYKKSYKVGGKELEKTE
ncbi:very long chain fatty acid elongase 4-like [Hetaerina americana]|uniref:very long chain fatty acid elongase 4-like n=1 Tax=Hetaerina americana TaxID=62018 RepID=UPI003A7F10CB